MKRQIIGDANQGLDGDEINTEKICVNHELTSSENWHIRLHENFPVCPPFVTPTSQENNGNWNKTEEA